VGAGNQKGDGTKFVLSPGDYEFCRDAYGTLRCDEDVVLSDEEIQNPALVGVWFVAHAQRVARPVGDEVSLVRWRVGARRWWTICGWDVGCGAEKGNDENNLGVARWNP
jgi:hypothetical protein